MTLERDWGRYGMGFERGMEHGRKLFKARIVKLLRARRSTALGLIGNDGSESGYWIARADLLTLLIREIEEL